METLIKNVSDKEKFHVRGEKTGGGMKGRCSRLEEKKKRKDIRCLTIIM